MLALYAVSCSFCAARFCATSSRVSWSDTSSGGYDVILEAKMLSMSPSIFSALMISPGVSPKWGETIRVLFLEPAPDDPRAPTDLPASRFARPVDRGRKLRLLPSGLIASHTRTARDLLETTPTVSAIPPATTRFVGPVIVVESSTNTSFPFLLLSRSMLSVPRHLEGVARACSSSRTVANSPGGRWSSAGSLTEFSRSSRDFIGAVVARAVYASRVLRCAVCERPL